MAYHGPAELSDYSPREALEDAAGLLRQAAGLLRAIPDEVSHYTLPEMGTVLECAIRLEHLVELARLQQLVPVTTDDRARRTRKLGTMPALGGLAQSKAHQGMTSE